MPSHCLRDPNSILPRDPNSYPSRANIPRCRLDADSHVQLLVTSGVAQGMDGMRSSQIGTPSLMEALAPFTSAVVQTSPQPRQHVLNYRHFTKVLRVKGSTAATLRVKGSRRKLLGTEEALKEAWIDVRNVSGISIVVSTCPKLRDEICDRFRTMLKVFTSQQVYMITPEHQRPAMVRAAKP